MKTRKLRKIKGKKMRGGKTERSGGFGCLFANPALKCKGQPRGKNMVTKLLTTKHAEDEYRVSTMYQPILKNIPNYKDYFLVDDITMCDLDPLTKDDLIGFNEHCNHPLKGITSKEINQKLSTTKGIVMPYGGVDVHDYMDSDIFYNASRGSIHFDKLGTVNNALANLLANAILPMNKLHIFHRDLKAGNVLISYTDGEIFTRIIDWGLSGMFDPSKDLTIPKPFMEGSMQFNNPFTNIILSDEFTDKYTKYLITYPNPSVEKLKLFINDYLLQFFGAYGIGHLESLNSILFPCLVEVVILQSDLSESEKEKLLNLDFALYFIINYIAEGVHAFTDNITFDLYSYFKNVFAHNVDKWGFVMIYTPILRRLSKSLRITASEKKLMNLLTQMLLYIMQCSAVPIDVNILYRYLSKINTLCHGVDVEESSSKKRTRKSRKMNSLSLPNTVAQFRKTDTDSNYKKTLQFLKQL